ncbi:MAG: hypothetical protein ACOYN3_08705, partial [Acidimicrobiia bacterium]
MAAALQCPQCGRKHRIDGPQSQSSFPCEDCGQLLKVPASLRANGSSSAGNASGASGGAIAAGAASGAIIGSNLGTTAAPAAPARPIIGQNMAQAETGRRLDADARNLYAFEDDEDFLDEPDTTDPGIGARVRLTRSQRRAVMANPLPWWGRLLAWLVALPVAGAIVLIPMRIASFFSRPSLKG